MSPSDKLKTRIVFTLAWKIDVRPTALSLVFFREISKDFEWDRCRPRTGYKNIDQQLEICSTMYCNKQTETEYMSGYRKRKRKRKRNLKDRYGRTIKNQCYTEIEKCVMKLILSCHVSLYFLLYGICRVGKNHSLPPCP